MIFLISGGSGGSPEAANAAVPASMPKERQTSAAAPGNVRLAALPITVIVPAPLLPGQSETGG